MNTHYTYFLILGASLAGPLALSFDKKVAFYKSWKYLFPAMIFPALLYIPWDIYFTSINVWSFNDNYITGIKLANLPVEEVLFFFVVPYCCVFIYECICCYFPVFKKSRSADIILQVLAIVLFVAGVLFYKKYYTSWTFIFCSLFTGAIYFFRSFFKDFNSAAFLVTFSIVLLPFLVVNGFLTKIPVVFYNDALNTGLRIYTIPFEDTLYGMLLVMMNIAIFEKIRHSNNSILKKSGSN